MATALATFMNANPGLGPVESLGEMLIDNPRNAYDASAQKSDTVDLTFPTKRLYVGGTGAIKVDMVGTGTVTFAAVPVGFHNIQAKRLYSTGTAATSIIGLY